VATTVLEVPEELKAMVQPIRDLIAAAERMVTKARSGAARVDYEDFERLLAERVAAVERSAHQGTLSALDVDESKILINGELHARVGRYETTFGAQPGGVTVMRSLYRRAGERNGPVVDVVALRAGAVEGVWLPGTARAMAYLLQQGTAREAEATAKELGRLPYSRSSFDRVGHAVGEVYMARHQEIEQMLIKAFEIPREARSISISLDRVSTPMEEPRPRPPGRPKKGAPKRPISRVYRMAYCGTVTLHDAMGEALHTIRYGTMPDGDPQSLCAGMADDVLEMVRKRPKLKVGLLCDGAPEMWNLLDEAFDGESFEHIEISRLIDYWHVAEKLAAAAAVLVAASEAPKMLATWKLKLLNYDTAPILILRVLVGSGREDVRVGECRPVHDAITYLTNNSHRMNYAAARREQRPIGSGNVEATCKSLVGVRMKRPGARWKSDTGEHVLHLRALALSDRWTEAMDITLRPPVARIRCAA